MKTEIGFILDRSGSMASMTHAAIADKMSASRRAAMECKLGADESVTLHEPMSESLAKRRNN